MFPRYIDIHSHLNFPDYALDREEVIKRSLEGGVWMINIGTSKETSKEVVSLAQKYKEGVYASIGLHPIHTSGSYVDETHPESVETEFDYEFYKKLALDPKVVAIGECGLDYFHLDEGSKERQKEVFKKHIDLSIDVGKPLMLHIRDAYEDTLNILNEYKAKYGDRLKGNVHFFAGNLEIAKKFLDLGFTFSFTGAITYPKPKKPACAMPAHAGGRPGMVDYEEIIKFLPLDKIMSETDAPYVSPVPYRGKRNESFYVIEIVKKIAEIKNLSMEEVSESLVQNSRKIFNLK